MAALASPTRVPLRRSTAVPLIRPKPTTPPSLPTPQLTPSPPAATTARPAATPASIVSVIDGDTIRVRVASRLDTVRLIGIDAPETGGGRTVVECFSREATDYLRSRLVGSPIALTTDPSQDLRDKYGRLLAYVWLADGTLVNEAVVASGHAHEYTYDLPYEFQGRIRRAEAAARAAGRGLWAANACPATPPAAIGGPAPATHPASRSGAIALPAPTAVAQVPVAGGSDVVISDIFFDGDVPKVESDEYAAITNRGTEPVNLAGWRLNADDDLPNQNFVFPDITLAPGESCFIYTNQDGAQPCHFSFGSGKAIWANDGECGHLYDATGAEVATRCYR